MASTTRSAEMTSREAFELPTSALLRAYGKHSATWQREYESHVN
jgi:hypothetical protein